MRRQDPIYLLADVPIHLVHNQYTCPLAEQMQKRKHHIGDQLLEFSERFDAIYVPLVIDADSMDHHTQSNAAIDFHFVCQTLLRADKQKQTSLTLYQKARFYFELTDLLIEYFHIKRLPHLIRSTLLRELIDTYRPCDLSAIEDHKTYRLQG